MPKSKRALLALCIGLAADAAAAQSIDPRVLQQLQGQLGAGPAASSQNDRRDAPGEAAPLPQPGVRIDTREEQELRRAEARAGLARLYQPSPIEREFQERLADPNLRQFGYELFAATTGQPGALTGSVGDDYVVGAGDDLVIQFQGATNDSRTVRVGRDGRLIAGALPPIQAAGRPLGAIRRDLEAATRRTLLGTEIFVSLGSVRSATIFVGGEVERPGQFNVTALADVSAALAQAGGVRKSGSLRSVRIARGGSTIIVDLYGLLGIGTPPALRLRDGDRIIVPVIGDTVAIAGNVARPGIYEIARGTSLASLLAYAGGAVRPRGNQIAISRIAADGSEQYLRAATLSSLLVPGDAVQLTGGSAGGSSGRIVLRGHVDNPGARALATAPTVRGLLGDARDLKLDTYLPMAVLIRRDPATAARAFEPVALGAALLGRPDVALRSDDRLYIFSREDIDFLNSAPVRRIVLGQPNTLRECRALDQLETLVRDSQTARFNVVTRAAFVVERGGRSEIAATGSSIASAARSGEAGLRTGDENPGAAPRPETDLRDIRDSRGLALSSRRLDRRGDERCPAVFEEEPELLPVLIENAVAVGGAVRRPGAYPVAGPVTAADLAAIAQGLIGGTSSLTLDVIRARGAETVQERIGSGGGSGSFGDALAMTSLSPGDDLRFNAAQAQFETGAVLLSGEFNRPGLYSIRKGETLAQLIARAGGVSPLAYPYGAIFTRRSVKELQQEGLRRTSRELTTALLSISARKETSGDALLAGQALISQLATVEVPGRVVIEADPRVLTVRPDLDTVLESGDAIVMPKRPNFVLALGDVSNPGALQFVPGKLARDYLREAGGAQSTADRGRAFLVLPNGTAMPFGGRGWGRGGDMTAPPGSTIIVPKNIDPLYKLEVARDVASIFGSLITSVATIGLLATR